MKKGDLPSIMPWHEEVAKEKLSLELPQALMVIGRLGDGLMQLCLHLATQSLAKTVRDENLLSSGTHPDLHVVTLIENTSGNLYKNILIAQIRDLIKDVSLTASVASHRTCVIVPACKMNTAAANALLKILEEPHQQLRFILGCEQPSLLPATIRSRCMQLTAPRPTNEQSVQWLQEQLGDDTIEALATGENAPLDAIKNIALLPARRKLADLCTGKKAISGQQPLLDRLDPAIWLTWAISWSAASVFQCAGIKKGNDEVTQILTKSVDKNPKNLLKWLDLYRELLEMKRLTLYPVDKRLLLERVCFRFTQFTQA